MNVRRGALIDTLERRSLLAGVSVTTTLDDVDGVTTNIDDLIASPGGAGISLREAVIAANNTPGADVIDIPAGTYTLSRTGVDDATAGDLDFTGAISLVGAGMGQTIVQAGTTAQNGIDKIFSFRPQDPGAGFAVNVTGMMLRNGRNTQTLASNNGLGGAMDFDAGAGGAGSLTMADVSCWYNTATNGSGGAIALLNGGIVSFTNVRLYSNTASVADVPGAAAVNGGGLYIGPGASNVTLTGCQVFANRADNTLAGVRTGSGGGIYCAGGAGATLTIHSSFINNNTAGADAGAIYANGTTRIDLSTSIRSNAAGRWGGGLYNATGSASLDRVEIASNSAVGALSRGGGGLYAQTGTITAVRSRFAFNTAGTGASAADRNAATGGTISATNNWWGNNSSPVSQVASGIASSPWLVMDILASTTTVNAGSAETSTITARITRNTSGNSGFAVPDGTTVAFNGIKGIVAPAYASTVDGIATGIWTVASVGGVGEASAQLDSEIRAIAINVIPAALAAPDLRAESDAGFSSTDNLTCAIAGRFDVFGAAANATVELLLYDSVVVGTRSGSGMVVADTYADGPFEFKVRQVIQGVASLPSPPLRVTFDHGDPFSPSIDLQAASDSGVRDFDNITNLTTPVLDMGRLESNSTLVLFRDSTVIATQTNIETYHDGPLAAGTYAYTAYQIDAAGNIGLTSSPFSITIDLSAPAVSGTPVMLFEAKQALVYTFSEEVGPSLHVGDFVITNLATSTTVPDASKRIAYSAATRSATITFADFPGKLLSDGNYEVALVPGGITDLAGNTLTPISGPFSFYILAGDANRDRVVDFPDLLILAQNYGQTGRTFSQGNFNYSADGKVDFDDLLLLAQRYGTALPASASIGTRNQKLRRATVSDLLR